MPGSWLGSGTGVPGTGVAGAGVMGRGRRVGSGVGSRLGSSLGDGLGVGEAWTCSGWLTGQDPFQHRLSTWSPDAVVLGIVTETVVVPPPEARKLPSSTGWLAS